MSDEVFTHNVYLSHSAKDKAVVRPLAERLRQDGLKVWFDEWKIAKTETAQRKCASQLQPLAFSFFYVRSARTGRSGRPARVGGATCPFATR